VIQRQRTSALSPNENDDNDDREGERAGDEGERERRPVVQPGEPGSLVSDVPFQRVAAQHARRNAQEAVAAADYHQ